MKESRSTDMKTNKHRLIKFGTVTIFIVLLLTMMTYLHEKTHERIFINEGCDDIKFNWFSVSAECDANSNADLLTSQNEIIGYNVAMPLYLLIIIIVIYIMKNNKGDNDT